MPLTGPALDNRRFDQLKAEVLARAPVHTPEWTNFNESDPGVTLVDMFAFLTESLLYRANLIPERNRLKFLSLLGVPLLPGASARGFVTLANERGPLQTITLSDDLEVRAGQVPFRTEPGNGLDVLPIETQVFYKRVVQDPAESVRRHYQQLYATYLGGQTVDTAVPRLYETAPFPSPASGAASALGGGSPAGSASQPAGVSLSETVDGALWVALLLRAGDQPDDQTRDLARQAIANRTLSLGILPVAATSTGRKLDPVGQAGAGRTLIRYEIPDLPSGGALSTIPSERVPRYKQLSTQASDDVLSRPSIVQIRLPSAGELTLWTNVDPLEMGVGEFPPALEDTALDDRLITWLRIGAPASVQARFLWVGGNAAMVSQRVRVSNERLPDGTGEPDQVATLSQGPVIPDSVQLSVTTDKTETWSQIPDLYMAGPEVQVPDPRVPPGTPAPPAGPTKVYLLDAEARQIRFGDGTHGMRPPAGVRLVVTYDCSQGALGNVPIAAINQGPALPAGIKVSNPVPTWGGVEPESLAAGEKQVAHTLQHQDRLVTAADFETITYRTPGVEVGRVEVLPAYSPEIGSSAPGDAPGAVTLMVIPRYDPVHPDAPVPDRLFLDAICDYLDPRRLVTTEVLLRAPNYRPVWVSIGVELAPRTSVAQVAEAVKAAVGQFLSPLPSPGTVLPLDPAPLFLPATPFDTRKGWPLRKPVLRLELGAVANRVPGVVFVNDVTLIDDGRVARDQVPMAGLDLPYLGGIAVGVGAPPPPESIPGFGGAAPGQPAQPSFVPVPVIPAECR